jgi:hypothetical protein
VRIAGQVIGSSFAFHYLSTFVSLSEDQPRRDHHQRKIIQHICLLEESEGQELCA